MSTDPATVADPGAETAGPDTPIPFTLTPQAEADLDGLEAQVPDPGPEADAPEPEADAEFLGTDPDGWEHFRVSWRDQEPEAGQ